MISSTMIGGFGDLFRALVSMSRAREVSAISGDQLKLKAMIAVDVGERLDVQFVDAMTRRRWWLCTGGDIDCRAAFKSSLQ